MATDLNRPPPPVQQVEALLEHLVYEIKMLLMTDRLLLLEQTRPLDRDNPRDWTIHNALFEAHTVHARVLYCFLFSRARPAA